MFFLCCGQKTNLNVPQRAQYSGFHPRPAGGARALRGWICSLNSDMMCMSAAASVVCLRAAVFQLQIPLLASVTAGFTGTHLLAECALWWAGSGARPQQR